MPGEGDYDGAAVLSFIAVQGDLEELHNQLRGDANTKPELIPLRQQYLRMPDIRFTPLNELNHSQPLLSRAFPTLYPRGQADYVQPRIRSITYKEYIKQAMKWHDGRFARHPRVRYVVVQHTQPTHSEHKKLVLHQTTRPAGQSLSHSRGFTGCVQSGHSRSQSPAQLHHQVFRQPARY